jgi:SNF2 family DNA or RNA helicase
MFTGTLRPFQEEAFERMVDLGRVLLAYDMGLGKTVITVATIEELLETGKVDTGIVVAAASLKYQWLRSIDQFSDCARVLVIDGDPRQREKQYRAAAKGLYEYVILSYDNVIRDFDQIERIPVDYMVLDEATEIKGLRSQRSARVKHLRPKYRYALTGQPIENRPEELFSIMQWVAPKTLGPFPEFERTFINRVGGSGKVERYRNLPLLRKTLRRVMVRKTRDDEDVRDQMPKVSSENRYVEFDTKGAILYRKIAKELLAMLQSLPPTGSWNILAHYGVIDEQTAQVRGEIMARLTALRMLCDDPALLSKSADRYEESLGAPKPQGSKYCYELLRAGHLDARMGTPKLDDAVALELELLDASPRNKIVVFSYSPDMLRAMQGRMSKYTDSVLFIGKMSAKERDTARQQFLQDPKTRLFLSSDAGGYGVDLPNANYLINYDLPWSAGKLKQRNARIDRLSSEFDAITVVNAIMRGSIEARMFDMLEEKKAIAAAWLDGKGVSARGDLVLNLSTLTDFLQSSEV